MFQITRLQKLNKAILAVGLTWIVLWVVLWKNILSFESNLYVIFIVDMLKLGVALGMFILPGALLYVLLRQENDPLFDDPWGILPIGFALSVTIIAMIGILGRLLGFSFVLVKTIFMLVGLGELILLVFFKPNFAMRKEYFFELFRNIFENIPLLLALILATSMTFNEYLFFIDDTTYLAYSTNWQYAAHLGFNNIVHQVNLVEHERFWLALYPMGQALLSDLSGVPGILLFSNYLELFLVPMAVITAYWFACVLGLSRRAAGLSALIQILLYTWMIGESWPVGFWFFLNLIEDKVSAVFLLAPVFFVFVLKFLQAPVRNNVALVFLIGIGLVLTHPVILFFSCAIAAGLGVFSWLAKRTGWREMWQLAVVFFALLLPYLAMRLYAHPSQSGITFDAESVSTTFQVERYVNVVNDVFYGLNSEVLKFFDIPPENSMHSAFQIFRLFPVILALIAGILAFIRLKDGALYWYILTCVLLVAFATIPYTGWILGYFVSARLISRASWFSPLGLAGVLVFRSIIDCLMAGPVFGKFIRSYVYKIKRTTGLSAGILVSLVFMVIMLVVTVLPRATPYFKVLDYYWQLSQIGAYIDRNTNEATTVIALDYWDIQMLPGVSAHANLISFREEKEFNPHNYFFSIEEIHERMDASNIIRSVDATIPAGKRCAIMDKYDVRFVIAKPDNAELFANLVDACEKNLVNVFETMNMILLEFK